jgi:hypothetical protein
MHKSSSSPVMGGLNDNFMYILGNIFFYCLNCDNKRGRPKDDLIFTMTKIQPGAAVPTSFIPVFKGESNCTHSPVWMEKSRMKDSDTAGVAIRFGISKFAVLAAGTEHGESRLQGVGSAGFEHGSATR